MPLIVLGIGLLAGGVGTAITNQRERDLARQAAAALEDQNRDRQGRVDDMLDELEQIKSGNMPVPIARVTPELVKTGSSALDAVDDAVSDEAYKNFNEANTLALSTQLAQAGADPRLKQFVGQKAVEKFRMNDKQRATELAQDDQKALQFASQMEQDVNKTNASNKLKADTDYTQAKNQFLTDQYSNLTDMINDQYEAMYGVDYQSTVMPLQAGVTAAARTTSFMNDMTGLGVQAGPFAEAGIKVPDYASDQARFSQGITELVRPDFESFSKALSGMGTHDGNTKNEEDKDDKDDKGDSSNDTTGTVDTPDDLGARGLKLLELGARLGDGFAMESGGAAAMTQGEFNHGDPSKPETGNDQVLLDQEDLKRVMDQGGVNSFDELMQVVPPQVVTTGGELVFNDEDSGNIEDLTKATDPTGSMGYAGKGRKNKTSPEEIKRAEAALAAYMRNLLGQERFQA
jgi:hypothetical protein